MPLQVLIYFLTATLLWGLNFHLGKLALQFLSPGALSFLRFFISAIGLLFFFVSVSGGWSYLKKHWKAFLALSFIGIFMYNFLFYVAIHETSAVNASLIVAFNPVITVLYLKIFFHQRITHAQVLGIFLSILGVFGIVSRWNWAVIQTLSFSFGDLLMIFVTSTFAFNNVYVKRWIPDAHPITTTFGITAFSLPFFAILFAFDSGQTNLLDLTTDLWAIVLAISLGGSVVGSILWNKALQKVSADTASLFVNTIPLFAMLMAPLFHEPITLPQILGGSLIIVGVLTVTYAHALQNLYYKYKPAWIKK